MTDQNPTHSNPTSRPPATLAEMFAQAEARRTEPVRPDSRAELLARLGDLPAVAASIAGHLRAHFPVESEQERQVLALAEEVGEFVGAYRRWAGMARRTGPWSDVEAELADVVITAYVTAHVLGVDLPAAITAKTAVIFGRGWKDPA